MLAVSLLEPIERCLGDRAATRREVDRWASEQVALHGKKNGLTFFVQLHPIHRIRHLLRPLLALEAVFRAEHFAGSGVEQAPIRFGGIGAGDVYRYECHGLSMARAAVPLQPQLMVDSTLLCS